MNIPECYHKKCFQNCNIKSQVDEVDIVDKQAIMKVHPMRTLGVEAILDLPAPPQQASCLENISQIELVSPKPSPHPQILNLQVGFSSPAPRKRTWPMNS